MRAVVITKHGDLGVLKVQDRPEPGCGPGEVRVSVRAAGINFSDLLARQGMYPDAPKPPCVVGYEVAGEVSEVGEGVTAIATGDRVMAGTRFGGQAEQVVVNESEIVPLPDDLSFEQGAAIPVNYSTAWAALTGYGSMRPGDKVLIHAAAGGVGVAAVQLAKHGGAVVHGTASPSKHEALLALGADEAIDYTRDGWWKGRGGYDLVLDAIGGASFARSYGLLRPGGRLIAYGVSSLSTGEKRNLVKAAPQALRMLRGFNLLDQVSTSRSVIGLNMLRLWDDRGTLEPWVTPLRALMDEGVVAPVVHEAVPFDRAADAHRLLMERRNVGKVVLVP